MDSKVNSNFGLNIPQRPDVVNNTDKFGDAQDMEGGQTAIEPVDVLKAVYRDNDSFMRDVHDGKAKVGDVVFNGEIWVRVTQIFENGYGGTEDPNGPRLDDFENGRGDFHNGLGGQAPDCTENTNRSMLISDASFDSNNKTRMQYASLLLILPYIRLDDIIVKVFVGNSYNI